MNLTSYRVLCTGRDCDIVVKLVHTVTAHVSDFVCASIVCFPML